jgi:hypothetical protein
MSSAPSTISSIITATNAALPGSPAAGGPQARLELKPDGPRTGSVDGGWWPRSRNLEEQLPALLAALRERLGRVESVSYHLGDWEPAPRRVSVGGVTVRLAGYRFQRSGTIDVIARDRRLTLLVIGPEQTEQLAHQALTVSAQQSNADDVATLLVHATRPADGQKEDER